MKKKTTWLGLCLAALAVLLLAIAFGQKGKEELPVENAGQSMNAPQTPDSLTYMGETYLLKENLRTTLLIGTDGLEGYEEQEDLLQDYYNYNQADFLMLLVEDTEANTTRIIQLNRDTMTDVPWLDVLGEYGGTEYKQLCLAFNSGDGGRASCKNTVSAVSSLLFDAPIQSYIQVPMSAIPVLNDLVGGVPVTIPEELTGLDPAFVKGSTVTLTGAQAELFVRARMGLTDDTNLARMDRQRIYLDSFQKQAQAAVRGESDFALKLIEKLSDYLQSDLTAQQLSELMTRLDGSHIYPIRTAEGELIQGAEHYEFYVDEASLWEIVKDAYCVSSQS